jgi:catechol 2,3-dioxygenase-like lactoylglutathione lyase family enzyme
MSTGQAESAASTRTSQSRIVDLKLEVVVIPVSDVDRAKSFYSNLGWRLDADFIEGESFRVIQFTPPGSPASIHFGKGLTTAAPGTAQNLYLVVSDIDAAHAELTQRGANISDVFHRAGPGQPPLPGRDPTGRSYVSFASFSDPDGNT